MKKITITLILTLLLIVGLAGCDKNANDFSAQITSVESLGVVSSTDMTEEITNSSDGKSEMSPESDESDIAFSELSMSEEDLSVEESSESKEETSAPQEPSQEESSKPPKTEESKPDESEVEESKLSEESKDESVVPEISEAESSEPASSEESEESQPVEESEPEYSQTLVSNEPEVFEEISSESEPFDINHWIEYAKSYAESVGLVLDASAVDCWDNPIGADAECIYLERDIQSRLNRYSRDEDITWVWIWAEEVRDNYYNLYIGYA